jgi:MFS family permease
VKFVNSKALWTLKPVVKSLKILTMRSLNPLQLLPLPLLQNHNIRLLFLQRFIRLAAYGSSTLILAQFFSVLHHSTALIGLFMTLTLYGDVLISLLLTLFADRLGRRKILLLGAALMTVSGITFATVSNFWVLLLAAIVGVVSPAGNEIGPFKAIEESVTAQIVDPAGRTEVFAWYTLVGALGSALGSVVCGWVVWWIMDGGVEAERAYRVIFWAYAVMGVVKMGLAWGLTEECEVGGEDSSQGAAERERLVEEGGKEKRWKVLEVLLPAMSKESLSVLWKLCLLFSIDSLASGLAAP